MTEPTDLLEHAMKLITEPETGVAEVHRDLARRQRNRKLAAGGVVVGIWLVIGAVAIGLGSRDDSVPVQTPSPTVDQEPNDAASPQGIFSGVGGWIAFQHGLSDVVRAVAPDGSEETIVLEGGKEMSAEDWSPDGSRLLVTIPGAGVAVIEPDGSETALVRFGAGPSFSPDGTTVAYSTGGQLWTVASDGSGEPRLLLEPKGGLYEPTYSPDGTRIAYVGGGGDHDHTISVVNADGTDVRVLIDATPPLDGGHIHGLDWSPDGSLLAVGLSDSRAGIYTIRDDGTDLRLLIPEAVNPVWSPDGSLIAYSPYSEGSDAWGVSVANADGSDPRMLSPGGLAGPWNPGAPADRA